MGDTRDNREKVGDARCQHRDASRVSRTRQAAESFRSDIIADRTVSLSRDAICRYAF